MKILVTGAAGFIGSHLAENLVNLGHEVIGIDCFTNYYSAELKEENVKGITEKGVKFYKLDLVNDKIDDILKGVEIIYHAAGQPGISDDFSLETYVRNNILATGSLMEEAKKISSLKLFIYFSTSSVYGELAYANEEKEPNPISYYGITKLAAEQLSSLYYKSYSLPVCIIRLFSVYGPKERPEKLIIRLIKSIFTDQEVPIYKGSLNHSRSFTYISDAVDGLISVLDKIDLCKGEIFNLGSDQEFKTEEAINIIEDIAKKTIKKKEMPARGGDQLQTKANIEKIKKVLSYSPKVSLKQGLENTFAWYKSYYQK